MAGDIIGSVPAQAATFGRGRVGLGGCNQTGFSREGLRAQGIPLRRAIARTYGMLESRVMGPPWLDVERYAATALVNDPADFQPLFQEALEKRFQMAAHKERQKMPVLVVRTIEGWPV